MMPAYNLYALTCLLTCVGLKRYRTKQQAGLGLLL